MYCALLLKALVDLQPLKHAFYDDILCRSPHLVDHGANLQIGQGTALFLISVKKVFLCLARPVLVYRQSYSERCIAPKMYPIDILREESDRLSL